MLTNLVEYNRSDKLKLNPLVILKKKKFPEFEAFWLDNANCFQMIQEGCGSSDDDISIKHKLDNCKERLKKLKQDNFQEGKCRNLQN